MNAGLKRFAPTLVIALILGSVMSGCSTPSIDQSANDSPATAIDPAAKELQTMVDDFYRQIKADAVSPDAAAKRTGGLDQKDFNEEFKGSLAYLKSGSMSQQDSRKMIITFARLYVVDPEAKVETAAEDFVVTGNTAYIKSGRLKVTTKGKLQPSYADSESATLSFERVGQKWLVSNFNISG